MSPLQRRLAARASIYVSSGHAFPPLRMSAALLLFTKLKIVPAIIFPCASITLTQSRYVKHWAAHENRLGAFYASVYGYLCNLP